MTIDYTEVEKLQRTLNITKAEAVELYIYDNKFCDSDKAAKKFLKEHGKMEESDLSLAFETPQKKEKKEPKNKEYYDDIRGEIMEAIYEQVYNHNDKTNWNGSNKILIYDEKTARYISISFVGNKQQVVKKNTEVPEELKLYHSKIKKVLTSLKDKKTVFNMYQCGKSFSIGLQDTMYRGATIGMTMHKKGTKIENLLGKEQND